MNKSDESFEQRMRPYYEEAFEILIQRQVAYGPDNILQAGEWGVFEQLRNKLTRAAHRLNGEVVAGRVHLNSSPDDQVFRDSIIDLINYAAILLALRDGKWQTAMRVEAAEVADDLVAAALRGGSR